MEINDTNNSCGTLVEGIEKRKEEERREEYKTKMNKKTRPTEFTKNVKILKNRKRKNEKGK